MIFDTHAHYDDEAFDTDREEVLCGLCSQGVCNVVNVGADILTSKNSIALAKQYPFVYAAVGVHPDETGKLTEADFDWLSETVTASSHGDTTDKIVAVGEIGLDYYWDKTPRDIQKKWFERQLFLSLSADKPVIIHSRDAAQDTFMMLKDIWKRSGGKLCGVIHCFSYSRELAAEYVKMGFMIGIGGVVTFKNAVHCKEVVKETPMERIVLETDAPYLAPVPFRGKRNDSAKLMYVAEEIAEIKAISVEEVLQKTEENAIKLYRL